MFSRRQTQNSSNYLVIYWFRWDFNEWVMLFSNVLSQASDRMSYIQASGMRFIPNGVQMVLLRLIRVFDKRGSFSINPISIFIRGRFWKFFAIRDTPLYSRFNSISLNCNRSRNLLLTNSLTVLSRPHRCLVCWLCISRTTLRSANISRR